MAVIGWQQRLPGTRDVFACSHVYSFSNPSKLSPIGRSNHSGFFVTLIHAVVVTLLVSIIKYRVFTRDFSKQRQTLFISHTSKVDWDAFIAVSSLDDAIQFFTFLRHDLCFPSKVVRMRADDKPWMTD